MNNIKEEIRIGCPMRHENGNCLVAGGFCTAVNTPICEALHNAYDAGKTHSMEEMKKQGYRKQSENTVELPCKVGQTVYVPWRYGGQRGVAIVIVQEIKLYDTNLSHCMFFIDMESDNECFNQSFGGWKTEQCIGKTVFLTLEEAETALRK